MSSELRSWLSVGSRSVVGAALLCGAASAQNADFAGKWLLALDYGEVTDYGILEIADSEGERQVFIDGRAGQPAEHGRKSDHLRF